VTRRRWSRSHTLTGAACAVAVAVAAGGLWCLWPLPGELIGPPQDPGVTLEDRYGAPLRAVRAGGGRLQTWVPLAGIDPRVIQAFIALEDRRFADHPGVDLRAVVRAARDNLRAGRVVSGASTLTMQLARQLVGSDRDWPGKLHQAAWALRIERHLDKQQILEQYLNRVPMGQGSVGVPAAARLYFDADVDHVSLGQAASLAAIARSPSLDNPLVSPARARARRAMTLARMVAAGFVSATEAERAAAEPLLVAGRRPFLAPHFTTQLLLRAETDGGSRLAGTIRTSLDLALQDAAAAEVRHTVAVLRDRHVHHAAAVVLDNRSGEILAWVGSPDFWADTTGQVDMVTSPRQPGSTLKPFVYGLAFDRGFTAASVLPDVARVYQTATGPYRPRNYDRSFHGPVRAREALASSFNIPAVELVNRLSTGSVLHTLHLAGFASLEHGPEYYGLGLALGVGDVTLLELANAYRALANGGVWHPAAWLAGAPGRANDVAGRRVMSVGAATLVLDILADPAARLAGFGPGSALELPFSAATKTGTSRHFTDNWAVVTTAGFTVAAWVGNFSGRAMRGVSGVTGAAPLAHRLALATARRYPPGTLPSPGAAGASATTVCRLSGRVAGADCPGVTEWFLPGTAPDQACDWHRPDGLALPIEYAEWIATVGTPHARPTAAAAVDVAAVRPEPDGFRIISPRDGDRYGVPPGTDARYATIALRAAGAPAGEPVRWYVDGAPVPGGRWAITPGRHVIRAQAPSGLADRVEIVVH